MNKEYLLIRDFSSVCFKLLKRDKSLIIIMLIYGIIASAFNILLPLSIQYVASQISTNASIFPVITIIFCLLIFLTFYAALKIVQIVAFSYFEKRFFITNVALMAMHNDNEDEDRSNYIQSYTEISNIIKYVGNFLFSTSLLIQQILIGLILTAFYHISFLVFNIILLAIIYAIFKLYFLRSVILYKKEIDVKYKIGNALCEIYVDRRTKINSLLTEYYAQKNKYFAIILQQNVIFFLLYAIANTIFLSLCSILTFKGYLTIPQFLASEIIFSLIFMNLGEFTKNLKNIYELLNSSHKLAFFANGNTDLGIFPIMTKLSIPRFYKKLLRIVIFFLILVILGMCFIPWWQTSSGNGKIIGYNQEDRVQDITSVVSGRVAKWYINDGQAVKKGDKIAEIIDNDPELINKLNEEFLSINSQYSNAKISTETGKLNYERQKELYGQGLTARKEFEKAKIEYQKLLGYENEIKAKVIQTDVKLSRQKAQIIVAPKDGFVLQSKAKANASYVYAGETIATFVPTITQPAIEMYISPNDIALIHTGRKARVQIEGWPALRVSGWPSTSIGTFGAKVVIIEQAMSANGKFRVILIPDTTQDPWPDMKYIKQGTNIHGWIAMNKVSIGYEIWRKMNGFPIKPDSILLRKVNEK